MKFMVPLAALAAAAASSDFTFAPTINIVPSSWVEPAELRGSDVASYTLGAALATDGSPSPTAHNGMQQAPTGSVDGSVVTVATPLAVVSVPGSDASDASDFTPTRTIEISRTTGAASNGGLVTSIAQSGTRTLSAESQSHSGLVVDASTAHTAGAAAVTTGSAAASAQSTSVAAASTGAAGRPGPAVLAAVAAVLCFL